MQFCTFLLRFSLLSILASGLIITVCSAVNVKDFGAMGDGINDDTQAIIKAISVAEDGVVEFPRGNYRITHTILIQLSEKGPIGLMSLGGSARIVMEAEGPAFRYIGSHDKGSAHPASVNPVTWEKERMPLIQDMEIVGDHPKADGIEFRNTMQSVLRGLLVREVRNGLIFTSRNRNVVITDCHIYNMSGIGIFLDHVNIHQMIISASHISYCKGGGIKVVGSQIRNFQIAGNDIEYNFDPEKTASADVWIDCSEDGVVREGTISGNTIQALPSPGGANIRITGPSDSPNKVGLWSISGNHISSQKINILLENSRGISIAGNNFLRGYDRHIVIINSRNITFSSNIIDRNEDYYINSEALGGVYIENSRNVIISNNIIEGARFGDSAYGGALMILESREVSVEGCHIINPEHHGIYIEHSSKVRLTDCIISEDQENKTMQASISLQGDCPGLLIRASSLGKGTEGTIINKTNGVVLDANISVLSSEKK